MPEKEKHMSMAMKDKRYPRKIEEFLLGKFYLIPKSKEELTIQAVGGGLILGVMPGIHSLTECRGDRTCAPELKIYYGSEAGNTEEGSSTLIKKIVESFLSFILSTRLLSQLRELVKIAPSS